MRPEEVHRDARRFCPSPARASPADGQRRVGFWTFLASNVLWVVWGWTRGAWALVALQFALAALNIGGACKNDAEPAARSDK